MGNILKTVEALARKMSFSDYEKPKECAPIDTAALAAESRRHQEKVKLTLYLTKDEMKLFDEIYIKRLQEGNKTDRSTIFSEAVKAFHAQELSKEA